MTTLTGSKCRQLPETPAGQRSASTKRRKRLSEPVTLLPGIGLYR
jgi:hypothetical protein